jgi:CheY-like chemotaxis protein
MSQDSHGLLLQGNFSMLGGTIQLNRRFRMSGKARILIVDDDKELISMLNDQLQNHGYDVTMAPGGAEAIAHIRGRHFDCVLLDLKMPTVSGYDVLPFIKNLFPKTRVIVLTAYADLKTTEKCKKLGADEVIGKPYDLETLFDTIDLVLGNALT